MIKIDIMPGGDVPEREKEGAPLLFKASIQEQHVKSAMTLLHRVVVLFKEVPTISNELVACSFPGLQQLLESCQYLGDAASGSIAIPKDASQERLRKTILGIEAVNVSDFFTLTARKMLEHLLAAKTCFESLFSTADDFFATLSARIHPLLAEAVKLHSEGKAFPNPVPDDLESICWDTESNASAPHRQPLAPLIDLADIDLNDVRLIANKEEGLPAVSHLPIPQVGDAAPRRLLPAVSCTKTPQDAVDSGPISAPATINAGVDILPTSPAPTLKRKKNPPTGHVRGGDRPPKKNTKTPAAGGTENEVRRHRQSTSKRANGRTKA